MKKKALYLVILFSLGICVILIFNFRYPFFTPAVGNWSVGYMKTNEIFPSISLDPENIIDYEQIDSLLPEKIHYIADPFYIKDSTGYYLFTEIKGSGNADIALFTSKDGLEYKYEKIIINEEFHLSYPQVFEYKKEYYMLPEAKGSGQLLLYKATNFPLKWKIEDTLLHNIQIKDPSILLSEDLNLIVGVNDNLEQFFFTADSLEGAWTEHTNYESRWGNESRPGGRFFRVNKDWYLPVQNRRMGYGTGISILKLINNSGRLALTLEHKMYLGPQQNIYWFNRGMHHLDIQESGSDYYMVYDGDRNTNGEKVFQYKRTIKFNLIDFYNLFR